MSARVSGGSDADLVANESKQEGLSEISRSGEETLASQTRSSKPNASKSKQTSQAKEHVLHSRIPGGEENQDPCVVLPYL